jgi:hypothetical protein
VIVKRVPLIKGARSRFGRYLAGGGSKQPPPTDVGQHNRAPAPVALWTRGTGALTKRFDGKEDTKPAPVSVIFLGTLIIQFSCKFQNPKLTLVYHYNSE